MPPFFYELRRAFTSKTILILTVIIVVLSAVSALGSSVTPSGGFTPADSYNALSYGYGSNDTYHIITYLYNGYGVGVPGVNINVTIGSGTVIKQPTNAQGYSVITVTNKTPSQLADSFYQNLGGPSPILNQVFVGYNFSIQTASSGFGESGELAVHLNQTSPYYFNLTSQFQQNGTTQIKGTLEPRYSLYSAFSASNPSRQNLMMIYEGNLSVGSPTVKLYYTHLNESLLRTNPQEYYQKLNSLNYTNMTYFASYSGFSTSTISTSNLSTSNPDYAFALFSPSGQELTSAPVIIYHNATVKQVNSQFFGSEMDIMGLFIPLMAAVSGYMTYGKDKTGLVLESVLVRPVSRRSIILSRFTANTAAVFAASVIAFALSSLIFGYFLGHYLPLNTFLIALFAMLVGIAGFIGLVYFASNMMKSQGAVLGVAIGLFFIFDLLWSFIIIPVIPFLVVTEVLKAVPGTVAFAKGYVMMYFLSPAGYSNLASYLVLGGSALFTPQNTTLAQLGLSYRNFIIGGALWMAVPLVLAVVSFLKRD